MNELAYLTQIAADFIASLPPSAKGPVQQAAQAAIDAIRKAIEEDSRQSPD